MSLPLSERRPDHAAPLLFALLCFAWGSTWLSLKIGVAAVPPLTFAAARFLLAAALLLAWAALRGTLAVPPATVVPGAALMVALNYGLMTWGIARVDSGIASVINLATVPTATLALAVAHGQARWSAAALLAVGAGAAGLGLLFGPRFGAGEVGGMLAIAVGAVAYAWGGILTKARPPADAIALAGWQSLAGGLLLAAAALLAEPVDAATLAALAAPASLANLAFLAAAGSVVGGSVYLMLLARWDAARVSAYAFVCPLIALAEGALLDGQRPGAGELAAAALLLAATGFSLSAQARRPRP
jgi:drug/metabolite transporter (DMT)-like permease